jgi:5-dehydro-4-deoxyglucarate dehydratase
VPVISGCGYGTAIAVDIARRAEAAGADGILLPPPYLMGGKQEGLAAHIEAVCRATGLGVIVYNRGNAIVMMKRWRACANATPIWWVTRWRGRHRTDGAHLCPDGRPADLYRRLPTAETFATPYLTMGVTTYSSAIFNFMPQWALEFYKAVRGGNHAHVQQQLRDFVLPYITLRDRGRGYAVSIVKAGCRVIGRDGPVRSPLTDLLPGEEAELAALIERSLMLCR